MSVVVRMEMPTSCEECPLVQTYENDWGDVMSRTCSLIYKGYLSDVPKGERRADCPIICQLPEGHGRLVDADKEIDFQVNDFERVKTEGIDVCSKAYSLSDLCDGITYAYDHANIIVPAERSEKK